jgi:hypothetical protein
VPMTVAALVLPLRPAMTYHRRFHNFLNLCTNRVMKNRGLIKPRVDTMTLLITTLLIMTILLTMIMGEITYNSI